MDDGLAFSPPGLPVRRWVTSELLKSGSQWLCVSAMDEHYRKVINQVNTDW